MRRISPALTGLALLLVHQLAAAQSPALDSAHALTKRADSLYSAGSAEDRGGARDLRASAVLLFRRAGDRARESETAIALGDALLDLGQPDSALAVYRQALALAKAIDARSTRARALDHIGRALDNLGRSDSVEYHYRTALAIRQALGDSAGQFESLANIANLFWARGQLDSALWYGGLALALGAAAAPRDLSGALNDYGLYHHQLGRYDSARVHYDRALAIRRTTGDLRGEGSSLNNIAGVFADIGEADSALYYFRASQARREATGDRRGQATTLDNIGLSLAKLGRIDSALVYHRRALALAREVSDRRAEGYILPSIANAFINLGLPDSAIAYNQAAVAIMRENGDRLYEASALNNLGSQYLARGDAVSARRYQLQALDLAGELGDDRVQARALDDLGRLDRIEGRPDSALRRHEEALAKARKVNDRILVTRILGNIALVYHRTTARDLGRAVAYYDSAGAVRSFTVRRAGTDLNRVSFLERYVGLFADWTLAWLARIPEMGTDAAYGSLAASERGRAQALLNLVRRGATAQSASVDYVAEGRRLAAGVSRPGTAGLVYQSVRDTLVIWVIGPDSAIRVIRSSITYDSLAALVQETRNALGANGAGRLLTRGAFLEGAEQAPPRRQAVWLASARALAAVVLPAEALRQVQAARELVVIPQGPLAMVPFAALPVGAAGQPLGATTAIRYAPSLATLTTTTAGSGIPPGGAFENALVVGNPSMPTVSSGSGERSRLEGLPGAAAEGRATAARLGAKFLTGPAATEGVVRRALPGATIVHFATHGFAYSGEVQARQSFVAFAPDSVNDGLLTVAEIIADPLLELRAELVVLSACQTGLGDLRLAEGTIGLQRALLARGARSVLVSLWNVSDRATRQLMEDFYRHWLDDTDHPSKAEALRRAQADVRATPGFDHPVFWAGFQLVGAA